MHVTDMVLKYGSDINEGNWLELLFYFIVLMGIEEEEEEEEEDLLRLRH